MALSSRQPFASFTVRLGNERDGVILPEFGKKKLLSTVPTYPRKEIRSVGGNVRARWFTVVTSNSASIYGFLGTTRRWAFLSQTSLHEKNLFWGG
jgi:hypothetical protein